VGLTKHVGQRKNTHKFLVGKLEGKRRLGDLVVDGRIILKRISVCERCQLT
jgi:hypothetical protein